MVAEVSYRLGLYRLMVREILSTAVVYCVS